MKSIKSLLYILKSGIKRVFCYPKRTLSVHNSQNYNQYWEEKRGESIGEISDWQKERADFVVSILKKEKEFLLGDIGCGDGSILHYIYTQLQKKNIGIGYDNSDFALKRAALFGIETHRLNINDVASFSGLKEVDYYLLFEILEHVQESEQLLMSALSKSKNGVFFSFPNTGYYIYRLRLLFGKFPVQWRIFPNEHVRFWTKDDLVWWLHALGISNFTIYYYKGIPFLNKILPGLFAAAFFVQVSHLPRNNDAKKV